MKDDVSDKFVTKHHKQATGKSPQAIPSDSQDFGVKHTGGSKGHLATTDGKGAKDQHYGAGDTIRGPGK